MSLVVIKSSVADTCSLIPGRWIALVDKEHVICIHFHFPKYNDRMIHKQIFFSIFNFLCH